MDCDVITDLGTEGSVTTATSPPTVQPVLLLLCLIGALQHFSGPSHVSVLV